MEVAQHLGDDTVQLYRHGSHRRTCPGHGGNRAQEAPITVPVGEKTLGRIFNVTGNQPIDNKAGTPEDVEYLPSLSTEAAPSFEEQSTSTELLETGIKVVDLLCPLSEGWKDRSVRRCRCRKDRADPGADPKHCHRARRIFCIHRSRRAYP